MGSWQCIKLHFKGHQASWTGCPFEHKKNSIFAKSSHPLQTIGIIHVQLFITVSGSTKWSALDWSSETVWEYYILSLKILVIGNLMILL